MRDMTQARVVRIRDTLSLEQICVSESYGETVRNRSDLEVSSKPETMMFGADGVMAAMP
jgi:hypothetical protein